MNYERIFTYVGIIAIILLIFGLGGWYLFLRGETQDIESAGQARGFSIGIPAFLGSRGSTAANTSQSGAAEQEFTDQSNTSALGRLLGFGNPLTGKKLEENPGAQTPADEEREKRAPRFWRVSASPVAGHAFTAGSTTKLRYIERASGHLFEADPLTGDVVRITNTLTPRVYEAFIGGGGTVVARTYDGNAVTLGGSISTTTENGLASLSLINLGADISDIALHPRSSELLMIARAGSGSHLIRSRWDGSAPKQVLALPGGDFRILWNAPDDIALVERAGSGIAGSAFRLAPGLVSLVRDVPGLTAATRAGSEAVLYGSDDGSRLRLFARLGGSSVVEIALPTTADKCVWAPQGNTAYCAAPQGTIPAQFLDNWYRGEVHTEDVWYRVDVANAKADTLFTIATASAIDVERPTIDESGDYLSFINARDKSLWMLRIEE